MEWMVGKQDQHAPAIVDYTSGACRKLKWYACSCMPEWAIKRKVKW